MRLLAVIGTIALIALGLVGGVLLTELGFDRIQRLRDLERVPLSEVIAVLPGEVSLSGRAEPDEAHGLLSGPYSGTRCLYYRATEEREKRDSDGNTRWEVVERHTSWVPFRLNDESGSILVVPSTRVDFHTVGRDYRRVSGKRRFTEYRIDPDQHLFLFGYADGLGDDLKVGFDHEGRYTPIISESNELGVRRRMATAGVFFCWGGLSVLSFIIFVFCWLERVHQVVTYLALVALTLCAGLTYCGLRMMNDDLTGARDRLEQSLKSGTETIMQTLDHHQIPWDGDWSTLDSLDSDRYMPLSNFERTRVRRIRIDLAQAIERTNQIRDRFPERVLAPLWGVSRSPTIPLPDSDLEELRRLDSEFQVATLQPILVWGPSALAILVVGFCSWFGLKKIKEKRTIENVPTCPTTGVVVGLTEIQGTILPPPDAQALQGPLSGRDCVQFRYKVEEKRGSGKNARWVMIENRDGLIPFLCRDDDGTILVLPEAAEILTKHKTKRTQGKRRYHESRLEVDDPLYALGTATIEPHEMMTLRLERGDRDLPYILSNYSEKELMERKAVIGQFHLNLGINGLMLPTLLAFGAVGSFQSTDFLAAVGVALAYFGMAVTIIFFNDLVFLRNRVDRAWSNIDVALKKRTDLIPVLETVVREVQSYERSLQANLSELRHAYGGGVAFDPQEAGRFLSAERSLLDRLMGLREAYPELKSSQPMTNLARALTLLENEIAHMRQGYNDAVERYNTRIAHLPEVFLARLFRFMEAPYFQAPVEVQEAPKVDLNGDERTEA